MPHESRRSLEHDPGRSMATTVFPPSLPGFTRQSSHAQAG